MSRLRKYAKRLPDTSPEKQRCLLFAKRSELNIPFSEFNKMVHPMADMVTEEEKEAYAKKLLKELETRT